ncbi:MAG: phosphoglycerate kinase [Acidobacteria bacterium]|jgi:3-phosphoglycerate kinase|nr:phosphoglycerate kinase [Acidobacteriota bacterium]
MKKKFIENIAVKGKRVFVRVDFNVPLNDAREISDDTRIRASLPTIKFLVDNGAKIICASHLGRPDGKKKSDFSMAPVAQRLSQLLGREVQFRGEIIGKEIDDAKSRLKEGDILLLDNLRFHAGETRNDQDFARELAKDIDIYVNDAFGASHRAHASIEAITRFVPDSCAGFLLKKEIDFLSIALETEAKNYMLILGGAKISDKIPLIQNLITKARKILIGGAMAYSFLKAKGFGVGNSEVEEDSLPLCKDIMEMAAQKNVKFLLPIDHIAAFKIEPEVTIRMIRQGEEIPDQMMGLDIGFETIQLYIRELKDADLIVWNGPLGVFEIDTFSAGTIEIARAVVSGSATTIVGGGDTIAAINKAGVSDQITHLSTGGGAALEFLSGLKLPGIEALPNE